MTADECKREIVRRLEQASGKPVIVQSDKSFSAHATIKIAGPDSPAHVLLYKPQFEAELPYLVAFQCALALRTIESTETARFDLTSTVKEMGFSQVDRFQLIAY